MLSWGELSGRCETFTGKFIVENVKANIWDKERVRESQCVVEYSSRWVVDG